MSKSFFFFGTSLSGESPTEGPDGHTRITKFQHGSVNGGTEEEHERMQEKGVKIEEALRNVRRKHGDNPDSRYVEDAVRAVFED